MEGRRIKKSVIYAMYVVAFLLVLGAIYLMEWNTNKSFQDEEVPLTYVSKTIFDETLSVVSPVNTEEKLIKPFVSDKVEIKKSFYDYNADSSAQENAIIYYENTYMQSTGIAYSGSEKFDIVAVLKGTVTAVTEDELLGNIIQIQHDNGLTSVYQSVSDVKVKVNDVVEKGTVIATSGTSNLFKDIENQLYFEIIMDGKNVNPQLCYEKTISEIKG
jgi:stage II sporulation protein Q